MADWRDTMVVSLTEIGVGRGIVPFDKDKVLDLMNELADLERGKPEEKRIGAAYAIDNYEAKGIMALLKKAEEQWPRELPPSILDTLEKKEETTHRNECVVSLKLNSANYKEDDLVRVFDKYLGDAQDWFSAKVVACKHTHGDWYDILVRYSAKLVKIYEFLLVMDWVLMAVCKPSRDFGKRTVATFAK